jgi:hypothetical protein
MSQTLWASTACYRDSVIFFYQLHATQLAKASLWEFNEMPNKQQRKQNVVKDGA